MSTDTFTAASSYLESYRDLLAILSSHGCVADYRIEGTSVTVNWNELGFDRALEEVKASRSPFGLVEKHCIHLAMLLWHCRKDRVTTEILMPVMNRRMKRHPRWSLLDIFFRKQ